MLRIISLAAFVTTLAGAAQAAGPDRTWQEGWRQSTDAGSPPNAAPVTTEGRNVATPTQGVEPYIVRSVEQNARSTR